MSAQGERVAIACGQCRAPIRGVAWRGYPGPVCVACAIDATDLWRIAETIAAAGPGQEPDGWAYDGHFGGRLGPVLAAQAAATEAP
jgi:hypothetical protein